MIKVKLCDFFIISGVAEADIVRFRFFELFAEGNRLGRSRSNDYVRSVSASPFNGKPRRELIGAEANP